MTHEEKQEITWQAPEFEYRHKDVSWYWFSILGSLAILILAIWQRNFLFGLFIVIAELTLLHWAKQRPKTLEFQLDKNGVAVGHLKFYSYGELEGFNLKEGLSGIGNLVFKTKSRLQPFLKIIVSDGDIPEMKKFLQKFLPEIEYQESLGESLGRIIGF